MMAGERSALLVGERWQTSSPLAIHLEKHGYRCGFAKSYDAAHKIISHERVDVILSPLHLSDRSVFRLLGSLEGTGTTLFYFLAVEDGCWWLPALRRGQNCFGCGALRSSEFLATLDEILDATAQAEPEQPVPVGKRSAAAD
jgi:DNA-binding NtrC family response regulator